MRIRPSKLATYMATAEIIAQRSHDDETQVGGVLVSKQTDSVIAQAFNGFIRGANDELLPNTRPDKYKFIQHCELNLICHCARLGISTDNCYLVCTMSPCSSCTRMLFQAGITEVICKEKYKDFEDLIKMKDLEIEICETPEGFFHLLYSARR